MPVCSEPGCPTIIRTSGRCPTHTRAKDRARGTRQQRGYDSTHEQERRRWARKVATGTVRCARCPELIRPGQAWDLGHTEDRTTWTGPEHATCNRAAAGRKAHS